MSVSESYESVNVNVEKIREKSQIYQLKPDDKLYKYHKAINDACFSEAMKDPTLLNSKHELQSKARQQLHCGGFQYKKKGNLGRACLQVHLLLTSQISLAKFAKIGLHS